MPFDFDSVIDRLPSSSTKYMKYKGRDILPLWVADMDFRSPPAILSALEARVKHGVFGYTEAGGELVEIVIRRLSTLYDWQVEASDIVFISGVVPALNVACRGCARPGQAVVTALPIYAPFMTAPAFSEKEVRKVPAPYNGDGWQLPLEGIDQATHEGADLLLLCNPWNPVGRALERSELADIVDICARNDVIICSDEIHCDLLFDGRKHVPTATISGEAAQRTITLMAPSKTFNVAGFGGSFAVIQNPDLRQRFRDAMRGIVANVNIMAYTSMLAAYRDCADWHVALLAYLQANRDFLWQRVSELEGIQMNRVEATYLAWLDVSSLELDDPPGFFEAAGLGMSPGSQFGDDRFMRLNFGCSRSVLMEAVSRLQKAVATR